MKKLLVTVLIMAMSASIFVGCGESNNADSGNDAIVNQDAEVNQEEDVEVSKYNRDASFELSNEDITCMIAYDSAKCEPVEYVMEGEKDVAYIGGELGGAVLEITRGSASAEEYVENFKEMKHAGDGSYYYVKDLVVEETESYEVNGFTYKVFTYSYVDVYTDPASEYDTNGMFGYVQLTEDIAILMQDFGYEYGKWGEFVETTIYVEEAALK